MQGESRSRGIPIRIRSHSESPGRRGRVVLGPGVVAIVCCVLIGCGGSNEPDLVEAGGTVTYRGEPVAEAGVVLVPDEGGWPAVGRTDENGQFSVATQGRPGAAVGSYKVAITLVRHKREVTDEEFDAMTDAQRNALQEWLIPQKYSNPTTSRLTAVVSEDAAQNQYRFDLQ